MDELQQIHLEIDRAAFDIKTDTSKKLHDILLTYSEDLMTNDISSKWDPLCSEDYGFIRLIFNYGYQYGSGDGEYNEEVKEYIKKMYPYVYDDDDVYYEIPFTIQYFYLREFAESLKNVFRNDFPEAFVVD